MHSIYVSSLPSLENGIYRFRVDLLLVSGLILVLILILYTATVIALLI